MQDFFHPQYQKIRCWEGQWTVHPRNSYAFYTSWPHKGLWKVRVCKSHITACLPKSLTFTLYSPSHVCHSEIIRLAITILGSFDNLSSQSQSSRENMKKQSVTRINWLMLQRATIPFSHFHTCIYCSADFNRLWVSPLHFSNSNTASQRRYLKSISFDHSEVQKSTYGPLKYTEMNNLLYKKLKTATQHFNLWLNASSISGLCLHPTCSSTGDGEAMRFLSWLKRLSRSK